MWDLFQLQRVVRLFYVGIVTLLHHDNGNHSCGKDSFLSSISCYHWHFFLKGTISGICTEDIELIVVIASLIESKYQINSWEEMDDQQWFCCTTKMWLLIRYNVLLKLFIVAKGIGKWCSIGATRFERKQDGKIISMLWNWLELIMREDETLTSVYDCEN